MGAPKTGPAYASARNPHYASGDRVASSHRHRASGWPLHGQPLAALQAPGFEHIAPTAGAHPLQKAMDAYPTTLPRLPRSLGLWHRLHSIHKLGLSGAGFSLEKGQATGQRPRPSCGRPVKTDIIPVRGMPCQVYGRPGCILDAYPPPGLQPAILPRCRPASTRERGQACPAAPRGGRTCLTPKRPCTGAARSIGPGCQGRAPLRAACWPNSLTYFGCTRRPGPADIAGLIDRR